MEIKAEIEISKNPEEIFLWINNPAKAMLWQKNVKSGEIIKETAERIGTTFKEELEEDGECLVMYGEIIDFIPNKLISFHIKSKIHNVYVDYSVIGGINKSTVTVNSKIKWKFPMNLICLVIGQKIKSKIFKQIKSELKELKILCETIQIDLNNQNKKIMSK